MVSTLTVLLYFSVVLVSINVIEMLWKTWVFFGVGFHGSWSLIHKVVIRKLVSSFLLVYCLHNLAGNRTIVSNPLPYNAYGNPANSCFKFWCHVSFYNVCVLQLYGEFAEVFDLYECKLAIVHCAGHEDAALVDSLWLNIINKGVYVCVCVLMYVCLLCVCVCLSVCLSACLSVCLYTWYGKFCSIY